MKCLTGLRDDADASMLLPSEGARVRDAGGQGRGGYARRQISMTFVFLQSWHGLTGCGAFSVDRKEEEK